jgi:hypothetical protein
MGSPGAGYVGEGLGAGLTGYGLSMNPQLQSVNPLQYLQGDQNAINQTMQQQQGMNQQYIQGLQNLGNQDYQNLTTQLGPTGQLGQQLSGEFANYGITPQSGAFQSALGNQYGQMMQNVNQQQAGALGQGYQGQTGLSNLGLQQQFGLEGQQTNTDLAQNLARFSQQSGLQQSLIGGGSNAIAGSAGK